MTSEPTTRVQGALLSLAETAWRYRAGEGSPEDLPMVAAEALAAGVDTPALCDLAGLPRNANTHDIREVFEQALSEAGIELPAPDLAQRYALRRLAARLVDEDVSPAELAAGDWWEVAIETAQERALVALIPQCSCCLDYTLPVDRRSWPAELRAAARALMSSQPVGPGC